MSKRKQEGVVVRDIAPAAIQRRSPSARLIATGRALIGGEKALGRAMVTAGYSPATAKNPALHGVSYTSAVGAALEADPGLKDALGIDDVTLQALQAASGRITDGSASDALLATFLKLKQDREAEGVDSSSDPPVQLLFARYDLKHCQSRIDGALHPENLEKDRKLLEELTEEVARREESWARGDPRDYTAESVAEAERYYPEEEKGTSNICTLGGE